MSMSRFHWGLFAPRQRAGRSEALRGLNLKSESKPPPPLTTAPSARKVPAHEHVTFPLGALRPPSARRPIGSAKRPKSKTGEQAAAAADHRALRPKGAGS